MKKGIVLLGLLISTCALAQEPWGVYTPTNTSHSTSDSVQLDTIKTIDFNKNGSVTINKDARIDKATDLQKGNIKMVKSGYRVQIKLSPSKDEVNRLRARFIQIYDKTPAHVEYNQPNFVLKVGDYYTRQQALEFKYEIAENFPAAIVVRDKIELPKLPENL